MSIGVGNASGTGRIANAQARLKVLAVTPAQPEDPINLGDFQKRDLPGTLDG